LKDNAFSNADQSDQIGNFSTIGLFLKAHFDFWKDEVAPQLQHFGLLFTKVTFFTFSP
jgi:hypothetical protein